MSNNVNNHSFHYNYQGIKIANVLLNSGSMTQCILFPSDLFFKTIVLVLGFLIFYYNFCHFCVGHSLEILYCIVNCNLSQSLPRWWITFFIGIFKGPLKGKFSFHHWIIFGLTYKWKQNKMLPKKSSTNSNFVPPKFQIVTHLRTFYGGWTHVL